jgi:hypothetical protein
MKKVLLILGVLVVVAALAGGVSIAYAKGNGNGNGNGVQLQERDQLCDQLLLGTIMQKTGNATAGTIVLLPRGGNTTVNIMVNSDTAYRQMPRPNGGEVTFNDLGYGDWIAVCANNNIARLIVLLQVPAKPFSLKLQGNVTAVNGNIITGNIAGGGTFTIDLTGQSGNYTGAVGQPVELNIGKDGPPTWGLLQGLTMRNLGTEIGLWMKNHGWMIGRGD